MTPIDRYQSTCHVPSWVITSAVRYAPEEWTPDTIYPLKENQ